MVQDRHRPPLACHSHWTRLGKLKVVFEPFQAKLDNKLEIFWSSAACRGRPNVRPGHLIPTYQLLPGRAIVLPLCFPSRSAAPMTTVRLISLTILLRASGFVRICTRHHPADGVHRVCSGTMCGRFATSCDATHRSRRLSCL